MPASLRARVRRYALPVVTSTAALAVLLLLAGFALPEQASRLWLRLFNPTELTLKVGVLPNKPMAISMARAVQQEIDDSTPFTVEMVPTDGLEDHIARLRSGELDFIIISGGLGLDPDEFRAVARVGQEFLHVVVPAGTTLRTSTDLAGKQVVTEVAGDPSRQIIERLIQAFAFQPPIELVEASFDEVDALFVSGEVAAGLFIEPVLGSGTTTGLLRSGRYDLVGVPQAHYLSQIADGLHVAELPMGAYGVNLTVPSAPVQTVALNSYMVTREDQGAAQILAMMRVLFSVDVVRRLDFDIARLSEEWGRQTSDYTLHPAARDFFDRDEPVSSDQFEIAAFFLAALLAVGGGLRILFLQWRRQLAADQRERIGAIMERLVELDGQLRDADPQGVRTILDQMSVLENEAEELWLKGRVNTEDLENFFERSGAKIRNAHLRLLETRAQELRVAQEALSRDLGHTDRQAGT